MAAGCKPAAPWSYGGSNPPLSTRIFVVSRFSIALAIYGLLALLVWLTLPDQKIRGLTLALLAMFAVKTWLHRRRQQMDENVERDRKLERAKLGRN
jgi:membrane protein implicated in regulation of membrane protease activity